MSQDRRGFYGKQIPDDTDFRKTFMKAARTNDADMTDHTPDASNMVGGNAEDYVKSVSLTVGVTHYRKRDLGPWLGYDDFLGRWLPVSQTQCEMLDHIAILTQQCNDASLDREYLNWLDKCDLWELHNMMGLIADGNASRYVIDHSIKNARVCVDNPKIGGRTQIWDNGTKVGEQG
jgi:hypothetical protein